ncbi:hypothetical protein L195_g063424, partial [Trifolium pratense]
SISVVAAVFTEVHGVADVWCYAKLHGRADLHNGHSAECGEEIVEEL